MNVNLSAIYWLWKREIIRFWRAKSRVIGSLGMPFFFLAIIGTGLNGALSLPGFSGSYMEFIAPGILGMVLLFGSIFSGVTIIMDRQFGFLKETLVAPVSRTSIAIGKALGGATTAVIQGLLMLVIALLMGVHLNLLALPLAIVLMVLISVAFVSVGIAIASMMEDMHGFQLVMNFLVMPMFFLSGALFPLVNAPLPVQALSYANPLTYGVEALRFTLTGSSELPLALCVAVLLLFFVVSTYAAAALFKRIES
ncbi:MAG: ABC transporter permease [Candidatus Micrarchaeia archaeon]|jgi:ABC-2 type transport system permease protein